MGPFFSPWIAVNLAPFTEGVDDTPGVAGTSGDYTTDALLPGGVEFEGEPRDMGTVQPYTEKWWSHSWLGSYVFPQASQDGWLYYRFTTQTSFGFVFPTAFKAAIMVFTNVSTISDVGTGSLFGPAAALTVDWPLWITLPRFSPLTTTACKPNLGLDPRPGRADSRNRLHLRHRRRSPAEISLPWTHACRRSCHQDDVPRRSLRPHRVPVRARMVGLAVGERQTEAATQAPAKSS